MQTCGLLSARRASTTTDAGPRETLDRALLYVAGYAVLPLDDAAARVVARLEGTAIPISEGAEGFALKRARSAAALRRQRRRARRTMRTGLRLDVDTYREAVLYVRHHAHHTCTAVGPHCGVCPLLRGCAFGQTTPPQNRSAFTRRALRHRHHLCWRRHACAARIRGRDSEVVRPWRDDAAQRPSSRRNNEVEPTAHIQHVACRRRACGRRIPNNMDGTPALVGEEVGWWERRTGARLRKCQRDGIRRLARACGIYRAHLESIGAGWDARERRGLCRTEHDGPDDCTGHVEHCRPRRTARERIAPCQPHRGPVYHTEQIRWCRWRDRQVDEDPDLIRRLTAAPASDGVNAHVERAGRRRDREDRRRAAC